MKFFWTLVAASILVPAGRAENVLVLPFSNTSRTTNLDWVGESIAETVREAIATQGLMAVNREDRQEAYRRLGLRQDATPTRATALKLGQAIDADQIIWGEFAFTPPSAGSQNRGSLRITARVLDLRHLSQGPEFSRDGALEELASLQNQIAWQTLRWLSPKSAPGEEEFKKMSPPVRLDAMESYMRGLVAANPDQRMRLFTQALRLEPKYSDAAFQLGLLTYSRREFRAAADWLQRVDPSDVHYSQAGFFLGLCRYHAGDYAAAQTAFERVAAAVPLNEVLNNLGAAQLRRNLPQALENFQKALDGDRNDPVYHFNVGLALFRQARYAEAADRFRAVLDRNSQDQEATIMLGRSLKPPPRPADLKDISERLKTNYEENAYRQLKALLPAEKP